MFGRVPAENKIGVKKHEQNVCWITLPNIWCISVGRDADGSISHISHISRRSFSPSLSAIAVIISTVGGPFHDGNFYFNLGNVLSNIIKIHAMKGSSIASAEKVGIANRSGKRTRVLRVNMRSKCETKARKSLKKA